MASVSRLGVRMALGVRSALLGPERAAGIDAGQVSRLEHGLRDPRLTIAKVADGLGASVPGSVGASQLGYAPVRVVGPQKFGSGSLAESQLGQQAGLK